MPASAPPSPTGRECPQMMSLPLPGSLVQGCAAMPAILYLPLLHPQHILPVLLLHAVIFLVNLRLSRFCSPSPFFPREMFLVRHHMARISSEKHVVRQLHHTERHGGHLQGAPWSSLLHSWVARYSPLLLVLTWQRTAGLSTYKGKYLCM